MRRVIQRDAPSIELLLLDAQGVLFNNPWAAFLEDLAQRTDRSAEEVFRLWYDELHDDAWLGSISDTELWTRLTGTPHGHAAWQSDLERRFRPGRLARFLPGWRRTVEIWVLSNHRSHWLEARLDRFGLDDHLERVLVSDALGAMKPDTRAFDAVRSAVSRPESVLFVDDQQRNVNAAAQLGFRALRASDDPAWIDVVDDAVGGAIPVP